MKKYFCKLLALILPITPLSASACIPSQPYQVSNHKDSSVIGEIGFDKLRITDLIVGILPYEREIPQDIIVTLRVSTNLGQVIKDDNLDSTVDYVKLAEVVEKEARESQPHFIDVYAYNAVERIFKTFPEVESATIEIEKPKAIPNAKSGGISSLTLTRAQFEKATQDTNEPIFAEIGFDELYIETVIGDLDIERESKQPIIANLRVNVDIRPLLLNRPLEISYIELADLFQAVADEGSYYMLETLATLYLNEVFKKYPDIKCAHVKLNKPGALPGYPFKTKAITEVRLINDD